MGIGRCAMEPPTYCDVHEANLVVPLRLSPGQCEGCCKAPVTWGGALSCLFILVFSNWTRSDYKNDAQNMLGQESHTNNDIYIYIPVVGVVVVAAADVDVVDVVVVVVNHTRMHIMYIIYIYIYHDQVSCDQIQCLSFLDVISNQTAWWGWYSSPLFKG